MDLVTEEKDDRIERSKRSKNKKADEATRRVTVQLIVSSLNYYVQAMERSSPPKHQELWKKISERSSA